MNSENDISNIGMFLLLNNHLSWDKEILNADYVPQHAKKFKELSCYGFTDKKKPIIQKCDITLIFDGYLSNYNNLHEYIEIEPENKVVDYYIDEDISYEYEIIIDLYKRYGIEYTLQLLDGEFSFILIDNNLKNPDSRIFVARDTLGLRPLYKLTEKNTNEKKIYGFSSHLQHLNLESTLFKTNYEITEIRPGSYSEYTFPFKVLSFWSQTITNVYYSSYIKPSFLPLCAKQRFLQQTEFNKTLKKIQYNLITIIEESLRSIELSNDTENPIKIACLLSGGLNSSLISGIIQEYIKKKQNHVELHTYSIGFKNSEDLNYAEKASQYLNTIHHEIIISEEEYVNLIPTVVSVLETNDVFTLRSGIAIYLLAEHVKNGGINIVFSGDGANELTGGYLYCHNAPDMFEFDRESRELLSNYCSFQGLFIKIMNKFNLSWQRPFLHQSFIKCYHSIPIEFRYREGELDIFESSNHKYIEKFLLRTSFSKENFLNNHYATIIPEENLWRTTTVCFDGICCKTRPIYELIQEKISSLVLKESKLLIKFVNIKLDNNKDIEKIYYQHLFELFFSKEKTSLENVKPSSVIVSKNISYNYNSGILEHILYKEWLPKYVDNITDPSSRKLPFYFDYNPEYADRTL